MYTSVYLSGYNVGRDENGSDHMIYSLPNESFYGTIVLNPDGEMVYTTWMNKQKVGKRIIQESQCDIYGFCGVFGSCDPNDLPICSCLRGFKPNKVDEWDRKDWAGGCRRRVPLQCERSKNGSKDGKEDGFLMLKKTKVPDCAEQSSVSEETCRTRCLNNCSCTAYAYDAGIGCMSWSGKLIDIVRFSVGGIDLYVREGYSELDGEKDIALIVTVSVTVGAIIIVAGPMLLASPFSLS